MPGGRGAGIRWKRRAVIASRIRRDGVLIESSEAFHAWNSCDLGRMLAAVDLPCHPVDRHYLLQSIVCECYKVRARQPERASVLLRYGQMYMAELPALATALRMQDASRTLPSISVFSHMEMALCEAGDAAAAVEIWRKASEIGYEWFNGDLNLVAARVGRRIDKLNGRASPPLTRTRIASR